MEDVIASFVNPARGYSCGKNIFEDVVIEYNQCLEHRRCGYLRHYVSIGIPSSVYNRIIRDVNKFYNSKGLMVESVHDSVGDRYTWITARLEKELSCDIYSYQLERKISIGSLRGRVAQLKSNVLGFGRFRMQINRRNDNFYFLKFTLHEFQLVDETFIKSVTDVIPYFSVTIPDSLKEKLGLRDHYP